MKWALAVRDCQSYRVKPYNSSLLKDHHIFTIVIKIVTPAYIGKHPKRSGRKKDDMRWVFVIVPSRKIIGIFWIKLGLKCDIATRVQQCQQLQKECFWVV